TPERQTVAPQKACEGRRHTLRHTVAPDPGVMSTVASAHSPSVDAADVDAFVARFASDLGAALHATTVVIGDRLGLYKALAEGPTDAVGLAARTGCERR